MNRSSSQDVYQMSNNLLKDIIYGLANPLSVCINGLLEEGKFPEVLKVARVCPIYKKGPVDQPTSYRPVSVIPVISKLIELVVYNQINNFFERNNLFNSSQFGFRKGQSTIDAIDNLVRDIHLSFENKAYAQATFCDLSKAFDCINHEDLISKLQFYGFSDSPLKFLKSYLSNRRQMVFIDNKWSQEGLVEWGVPQGSVLGPLLFLICINDMPHSVNSKTFLYADDTTFLNSSINLCELNVLAKNTLKDAQDWFSSNGFLLNEEKTVNILFSLKSNVVPINNDFVQSTKFLGIHIDDHLTWNSHIDYLSSRLSRIIFLLRQLTHVVPKPYVRTSYFAYFQSVLRYGLVLWGNSTRVSDVLILQKRALRAITNSDARRHCKPLFIQLEVQTVINLYIFDLVIYILKKPNLLKFRHNVHSHNTRNKDNISVGFHRLTKTLNSHIVLSCKIYNALEPFIDKYNLKQFKHKFYLWLLKHPFYDLNEFFSITNEIDF